jgi:hypothetical protein
VLDRAASAQHLAIANDATAVVWIDNGEVWIVSADGRDMRHAPLADSASPHVFGAIAASLLGEMIASDAPAPAPASAPPAAEVAIVPVAADPTAPALTAAAIVRAPETRRRAPRFDISGGTFLAERGMQFHQDPADALVAPPSYPGAGFGGVALQAAVFPRPEQPYGEDLTGPGATISIQKSTGAELGADDLLNDTYGRYSLDYTAFDLGVHYRHQTGPIVLDGMINFGRASWSLESDFPQSIEIPDTSYDYLGAGAAIELAVTERARLSLGARYMYLLSTGDISDQSWYGSGASQGFGLDVGIKVPITSVLYLRGSLEYRRIASTFIGDGNLSSSASMSSLDVSEIIDSWFTAGLQIGAAF